MRTTWWTAIGLVACVGCSAPASAGGDDAGEDAPRVGGSDAGTVVVVGDAAPASDDGASPGPSVYDGGPPAVVGGGEDGEAPRDAGPPSVCAELAPLTTESQCTAPASPISCPACAPTAYACAPGAQPPEVVLAGGECFAADDAGSTCCTIAACTQTIASNADCADGGAYFCPPGAGGVPSLHCSAPNAGDPTLECCGI